MKVSAVTVLICTYNRAPLLHETLVTLQEMQQPDDCDVNIIVVDNNSSDDTARIVMHAAANARYPVALLHERKQGKSFALNTGLAASTGDVVALTDDDVLPATDWLVRIVEAFRTREITFVFGKVLPRWSSTPPAELLTPAAQAIWGPLAIVDYGDQPTRYEPGRSGQRLPIGANLAFLRSALVAIGGWRTDLGKVNNTLISGEDHEIFMRLRRLNLYAGFYDPANFVRHYVPAARLTRRYFRRWFYWSGKTHALMLADLYPELQLSSVPRIAGVPRFLYRQALEQIVRYVRSRRGDALRALIEELRLVQHVGLLIECWRRRQSRAGTAARAVTAALLAIWLQFHGGRVSLVARDATVPQILAEWARVGGTRVDNGALAPAGTIDVELSNVAEAQALQVLLRNTNVVVIGRPASADVAPATSQFERIVLLAPGVPVAEPPARSPIPENTGNPLVHPVIGLDGLPVADDQ